MSHNAPQNNDLLYQENPQPKSRNPDLVSCSFTESLDSYQRGARQEAWVLENNYRVPNHEIVLRFHRALDIASIRRNWKRLRLKLKQAAITYAAAVELTDGYDDKPNNCVHYHFLIDTTLRREELRETMKTICLKSNLGKYGKEYDLIFPNAGITDWGTKKIHYFTKFNHSDKVRLFKVGLRLRKFYYSSDWFIEADGTPTKKAVILDRLKREYKTKKERSSMPIAACPILAQYDDRNSP